MASPAELWDSARDDLSDDWRPYGVPEIARYDHALLRIEELLGSYGKSLSMDFNLPLPSNFDPTAFANRQVLRELEYDSAEETSKAQTARAEMYTEQAAVYDEIVVALENQTPLAIFVDELCG